jgi:hypothetical protein
VIVILIYHRHKTVETDLSHPNSVMVKNSAVTSPRRYKRTYLMFN